VSSHQHLYATSQAIKLRTSLDSKLLQEDLEISRRVVEFMTKIGSDIASISDATHAWMEIQQHLNSMTVHRFSRISVRPREDVKTVREYLEDRICKDIEDVHWLALFLDRVATRGLRRVLMFKRRSSQAFLHRLFSPHEGKTIGNTRELQRAQKSLKHLATSGAIQVC
jgi:hypothetical protein